MENQFVPFELAVKTKINGIDLDSIEDYSFDTYEQARYACLEKLIELCKQQ